MKIRILSLHPYEISLRTGQVRRGSYIKITTEEGYEGWGEIAPLPGLSLETLDEALLEVRRREEEILQIDWTSRHCLQEIGRLDLLPSVSFGLESALLSILAPVPEHTVSTSALLIGSPEEIMRQAELRRGEGYVFAKLKVGNLSFENAGRLIDRLKNLFRLRVDVNRAWKTDDSLRFFERFSRDAFDYVEEPFQNPDDLSIFPHPLAVDESFPRDLSIERLESLPTLKALIYKPMIRGGLANLLPLYERIKERGIDLVLSSSFESDIGLAGIASIAGRLSLPAPIGIGTYRYLDRHICYPPLEFVGSFVRIPGEIQPDFSGDLDVEQKNRFGYLFPVEP